MSKPRSTSRRRRMIFAGATALAVTGGGLGVANAQSSPSPSTTPQTQQGDQSQAGDKADENIKSSVTAPDKADNGKDSEAAADAALAKLATVSPDQAKAAALQAVSGTAATPHLSNENGNVIYDVPVTSPDGKTSTDVKIDAGNAKVLAQEVDNEGADGEHGDNGGEHGDNGNAEQPGGAETPDHGQQGGQTTGD